MTKSSQNAGEATGRRSLREVAEHAGVAVSSVSRVLSGHPDVSDGMTKRVNAAIAELGYEPGQLMPQDPELRRKARSSAKMREVAEHAGVAVSSVSRVLTGHQDVSEEMRDRVLSAVAELGYRPDLLARSMRRPATMTCGILVNDVTNPLFARMVTGAERTLGSRGYSVLLAGSAGDPHRDADAIGLFEQRRVDGLLLALASETDQPTLERLRASDTPVVLLDRDVPADIEAGRMISRHDDGMREAVGHLVDLGHRRISLVAGKGLRPTNVRVTGFRKAIEAAGADVRGEVVTAPYYSHSGDKAVAEALAAPEPPTALIVGGNQFLLGALEVIRERGLRLGVDLSLVSCDETQMTRLYDPPIAVVQRDLEAMGSAAAEMLLRLMSGEGAVGGVVELGTKFVPRASCQPPQGG